MKREKVFRLISILAISTVIIFLCCCKKTTQGLLTGTWNRIDVEDLRDTTFFEKWEFLGDGTLLITSMSPNPPFDTTVTECHYFLKSYWKFAIDSPSDGILYQYDGIWQIVKRNKSKGTMMIVQEQGGLLFREFKR